MALLETLTDNFDDGSIDTGKWPGNYNLGGNTLTETGGEARVTLDGTNIGYSSFVGSTYDLTGSFALLKATTVPNDATDAEAYMNLVLNGSNYLSISKYGTTLGFLRRLAGVNSTTTTTYNSTNHLWWRIRESGGNILWDTSADGLTWTNQKSLAPGFAITALEIEVGAGCYQVETSPGSFYFDDFNIPPASNTDAFFRMF